MSRNVFVLFISIFLEEGFYGPLEKTVALNAQIELMGESCFITEIKLESTIIIRFAQLCSQIASNECFCADFCHE